MEKIATRIAISICFIAVAYFSHGFGYARGKASCLESYFNTINKWQADQEEFVRTSVKIINCESRGNELAIGDNGKAHSWLQFHEDTFYDFVKESGNEDLLLDWKNPSHQFRIWRWAYSNGKLNRWTCAKKIDF